MSTNEKLELMVADCNLLRRENTELIQKLRLMDEKLFQMELALQSWKQEPSTELPNGPLTDAEIEDIITDLELEDKITDHIHQRTDWDDVVDVDLSLRGNEIETELDADRYKIERYISRDLSSVLEECIREVLQNFNIKSQEVSDDSI